MQESKADILKYQIFRSKFIYFIIAENKKDWWLKVSDYLVKMFAMATGKNQKVG